MTSMRLKFLPVNNAWAFVFGHDIRRASIIAMGEQTLFATRSEAVAVAKHQGIDVSDSGLCRAIHVCVECSVPFTSQAGEHHCLDCLIETPSDDVHTRPTLRPVAP